MATVADAIRNEDCLGIEDLAKEFQLGPQRMRQVVETALKERIVPNITKKDGRRILYTPQMVQALKEAADKGKLGKFNRKKGATITKSSLKHAQMVIQVPVFDEEIATLLKKKFETNENMGKFLKDKLEETVKPILIKKRELMEKFEREMNNLIHQEMSL